MTAIVWNLTQIDLTADEAQRLAAQGVIYDPHAGDPEAEVPEGAIWYPEDDWGDLTPEQALDRAEAALIQLRTE